MNNSVKSLCLFAEGHSCFADIMEMKYDPTNGASENAEGVEVRVPGFGDTSSVAYLDPSWKAYFMGNVGSYAESLISSRLSCIFSIFLWSK